ncbi:putative RNA-binding protein, contains TRAM domain [Candidatus Nitrososphaera evergladensis SR1]|uniref:Putative RNA-binding protein, contains TRAM domain n=1 Tax=Candidatus Nitrososphaera evergladensis SR1 TaxID=1459636 RepID=A0A075MQI1_9ARCH|nr:TRAM domain-containing protein [Candidatus Nitrososphaera evergladensis]AIF83478.1 putative RNA-binding protein, contains TRAM domain [Candidatus Nitrososphaera evergladensis SR1]
MEEKGSSSGSRGPRRFGGPRPFRLAPVSAGQEYDVTIESMSRRGDSGVAKIQGLVVFVAGTKAGDSVRIRITKVGSGFATAEVATDDDSSIESLSPDAEASADSDE